MADDADDLTANRFLEVYLLWLFGWVLFRESAGDSASRCMILWAQRIADAPLEQMPQISWGSVVLAATYRGLRSIMMRPTSREAILLGCPLLLQMWIHERFDIGRPRTDLSDYEPVVDCTDPADLPTMGSLWCLRKVMTSLYVILRVTTFVVPLTFLVLCSMFGLGSNRRRPTRTSLVRSTRWSMPRSGGRRTLLPWSLPAHHRGSRPCAPETRRTG
jgi:hypothetical protein